MPRWLLDVFTLNLEGFLGINMIKKLDAEDLAIRKKRFYGLMFLISTVIIILAWPLPLPEHEQGIKVAEGSILSCVIKGRNLSDYTVRLSIEHDNVIKSMTKDILRGSTLDYYRENCKKNMKAKVWFYGVRRLLRPELSYIFTRFEI